MSDQKTSEEKETLPAGGRKFIRERIAGREKGKHGIVKTVMLVCVLAAVFGVIAAISFFISGNILKTTLTSSEEVHESVSIPRDQMPSESSGEVETTVAIAETVTSEAYSSEGTTAAAVTAEMTTAVMAASEPAGSEQSMEESVTAETTTAESEMTESETAETSAEEPETSESTAEESETAETDESEPETDKSDSSEPAPSEPETGSEALRQSVEDIVNEYLAQKEASSPEEKLPAPVTLINEIRNDMKHCLVTVTSLQATEDVFKHTFTRSQESFGLIVAVTGTDAIILTESYLLEDADSVRITLGNGAVREASLRGQDNITGTAVVALPLSMLDSSDMAFISPVKLGNSYLCSPGDMVVAMGRPLDNLPSLAWGIISYVRENVQGTDICYNQIQTDIIGDEGAGGVLVNTSGEVIGWIQDPGGDWKHARLAAIAVSDMKSMIECIANGTRISMLGVQVEEVTPRIAKEYELPQGLYITNTIPDSPAFNEGIQNGDILTGINDKVLVTPADLQAALQEISPGSEVTVKIKREGRDGFAAMVFILTLDER